MKTRGIVMKTLLPALMAGILMTSCTPNGTATLKNSSATPSPTGSATAAATESAQPFTVSTSAFADNGAIPLQYSGYGANESFPLSFSNADLKTQGIAVIMDDPDAPAGTFTHWVIWNIPGNASWIPGNLVKTGVVQLLMGAKQGSNDTGKLGYFGPMPPSGTHTYMIKAYTLDVVLSLTEGSSKADLESAMQGHILQTSVYKGTYTK